MRPESSNPYQSPVPASGRNVSISAPQPIGPIVLSAAWILFLALFAPAIGFTSQTPVGHFLGLKIVTTCLSFAACGALLGLPRRRWLALNLPAIAFLFYVQIQLWVLLP